LAAVERAAASLRAQGAVAARLVGGGFGGSVLGLYSPAHTPPVDALQVRPSPGALCFLRAKPPARSRTSTAPAGVLAARRFICAWPGRGCERVVF
jgi:hypothetical protein